MPLLLLPALTGAETTVLGDLPRRGWFGAQLVPGEEGLRIASVTPGASAAAADLREGDLLLAADGVDLPETGALSRLLAPKRSGDAIELRIRRDGEEQLLAVPLVALPFEQSEDLDVVYDVVEVGDLRLRSVLTRPRGATARLPAILFIQGLQCTPPDEPIGPPSTVLQLLHELTRAGYVVMRCEKPGSGDATGPPCADIGFHDEVAGFRAALAKLLRYGFIDPSQIFLFGHSMGGIEAPILAAETPVRGVIVFGTGVFPWAEYLVENERRQSRLDPAADPVQVETRCRHLADLVHEVLRNGRSVDEVIVQRPELAPLADEYWPDRTHSFGRHLRFYRELDGVSHADVWAKVDAPVLAMWGDLDYTTSAADHETITRIVNSRRTDSATFVVLPGVFHAFNRRDSVAQTLEAPWQGPLAEEVVQTTLDWLRERR